MSAFVTQMNNHGLYKYDTKIKVCRKNIAEITTFFVKVDNSSFCLQIAKEVLQRQFDC